MIRSDSTETQNKCIKANRRNVARLDVLTQLHWFTDATYVNDELCPGPIHCLYVHVSGAQTAQFIYLRWPR